MVIINYPWLKRLRFAAAGFELRGMSHPRREQKNIRLCVIQDFYVPLHLKTRTK